MKNSGWIKLHRQIIDNWIWEDAEKLKAWLDILMMVNHEDKTTLIGGKLVTIHRGEKLTSTLKLAARWGWGRARVRTFLELLERDGMCTTDRTANGTTIKVSNYAEYQGFQIQQKPTNDTTDSTTDSTTDRTTDSTTDRTQTINIKNTFKNIKNDKDFFSAAAQKKVPPELDDVKAYCRERGYRIDEDEFMTYYELHDWTLTNGLRMTDWRAAVDYWNKHSVKEKAKSGQNLQAYELYKPKEVHGASVPYEGGLVAEMRKRKEKA